MVLAFIASIGLLALFVGASLVVLVLSSVARRLSTFIGVLLLIEEPGLGSLEFD